MLEVKLFVFLFGKIEVKNLFYYYGWKLGGFDNVLLIICFGEKVGLVGWFGVGKLMLVKLLLWFYDVESG